MQFLTRTLSLSNGTCPSKPPKLAALTYKRSDPMQSQLEQVKGVTTPNPPTDRNDSEYQASFFL